VVEFGESIGVKNGGVLDHLMRHVRVECLPANLPSEITVDVTALDIGGAIHVGELPKLDGVIYTNDPELPVFMVHAPKVEEEVAPTAAVAPEVINQKKDAPAEAEKKEK
jgi:large subunit ribosomal protein L25